MLHDYVIAMETDSLLFIFIVTLEFVFDLGSLI